MIYACTKRKWILATVQRMLGLVLMGWVSRLRSKTRSRNVGLLEGIWKDISSTGTALLSNLFPVTPIENARCCNSSAGLITSTFSNCTSFSLSCLGEMWAAIWKGDRWTESVDRSNLVYAPMITIKAFFKVRHLKGPAIFVLRMALKFFDLQFAGQVYNLRFHWHRNVNLKRSCVVWLEVRMVVSAEASQSETDVWLSYWGSDMLLLSEILLHVIVKLLQTPWMSGYVAAYCQDQSWHHIYSPVWRL